MNNNNNANVDLTKIKGSLNRGELLKLWYINKTRDKNRKESIDIKSKRTVEVREQLKYVGVAEDDYMGSKFQKLKEAFDRGKV